MTEINLSFDVLPAKVGVNGQALLRWRTTNATSCVLDPGNETLPLSGSKSVTVGQTTAFTITARNEDEIQQQQRAVEVDPTIDPNVPPHDLANAVVTAGSDTLLSYSILPIPSPLQANTAGQLVVSTSNTIFGGPIVTCKKIVITLPVGTDAKSLTADGNSIESAKPKDWDVKNANGILTCTPTTTEASKIGSGGLSFTFSRFTVNAEVGTCRISIDETAGIDTTPTERSTDLELPKFPVQFSVSELIVDPTDVPSGGSTTLNWTGSQVPGAVYTLSYQPKDEGVPITVPAGNVGPYVARDLTRTGSVVFTLTVTVPVPGEDKPLVVQRQKSVNVATLALSFSVQPTSVGANGLALLQWKALNAATCVLDPGGETVPTSGARYVIVPQTTSFTITAHNAAGGMKQEQRMITVDPSIVPNIAGQTIVGQNGGPGRDMPDGSPAHNGDNGGNGGDAILSGKIPPLDTSSRPPRVMPISLTGGNGGRGGNGGNEDWFDPDHAGAGGWGGNGGRGGDVGLDTTFDTGAPVQYIVLAKPGKGNDGGTGGDGKYGKSGDGSRGRDGIVSLKLK